MSRAKRGVSQPGGEDTPVNPYSLLDAVNASSDTAHVGWLLFLGLITYLTIAVAGVTHKDLLLQTPVALPILQVSIQQAQFFQFAPVLLVLLHMGVVSQLVLVAKKTLEFDSAVQLLESTERRSHPLRLELHNFFFVQAIAGPHRSRVMSLFLHGMSWLTLVVLPVILLLFIQIRYLPFHDAAVTWVHRLALVADILMLMTIGIFLLRGESSFGLALGRTARERPISFITSGSVFLATTFFSFFVATIPGETLDQMSRRMMGNPNAEDPAKTGLARAGSTDAQSNFLAGFALPFLTTRNDGALFGVFYRNLIAPDVDFLSGRPEPKPGETSVSLRGRDLRYAKLDRSNLAFADLTGADLDGASLIATDLGGAKLQCADLSELILSENRAAALCASARGANFTRANLKGARLSGIDMQAAKFEEAQMEGAELAYAVLSGANFSSAHMERVDMTGGAHAEGANFLIASLAGADLTGALLHGADFSSAAMQGVLLSHARMASVSLRDTDLEGADLSQAKLEGADLTGAKLRAADLRGASVWQSLPPASDAISTADLSELAMKPLAEADIAGFNEVIGRIDNPRTRNAVKEALGRLGTVADSRKWQGSPDQGRWQGLMAASTQVVLTDPYKQRISEYLGTLACKARWSNGHVGTGVAKRIQGQQFRGDMPAIYDRLRGRDCPASETIARKTMRDLASAVDNVRGN